MKTISNGFVGDGWEALLEYFRNLPDNEPTREFTAQAEVLYTNERFNTDLIARAVFHKALRYDPSRLTHQSLRKYLVLHRHDYGIGALYMKRCLNIDPTEESIGRDDRRTWAMKSAIAVVAVRLDCLPDYLYMEREAAKGEMRNFCHRILTNFPNLDSQFKSLLYGLRKSGELTVKQKLPSFASAIQEVSPAVSLAPIISAGVIDEDRGLKPTPEMNDILMSVRPVNLMDDPWLAQLAQVRMTLQTSKQASA